MRTVLIHFFGQQSALVDCFRGYHGHGNHWVAFWPTLQQLCTSHDIRLVIDDCVTSPEVDLLWVIDLPSKKEDLDMLLRRVTYKKALFHQVESPLSHPARLNPLNSLWASALISYDQLFLEEACKFQARPSLYLPLSLSLKRPLQWNRDWHSRNHAIMINTNHTYGFFGRPFGHGLVSSLPVLRWYFSGYNISSKHVFELLKGEMYSTRRKLARSFEKNCKRARTCSQPLHIYGSNWSGEPTSWIHKLRGPAPFLFANGKAIGDKLEWLSRYQFTISFENYKGKRGYISEKLIDPLLAGSVPVYYGDRNVASYVPFDCFVDARVFRTFSDLIGFLAFMPEKEWHRRHEAGTNFLSSSFALQFEATSAANKTAKFLQYLLRT